MCVFVYALVCGMGHNRDIWNYCAEQRKGFQRYKLHSNTRSWFLLMVMDKLILRQKGEVVSGILRNTISCSFAPIYLGYNERWHMCGWREQESFHPKKEVKIKNCTIRSSTECWWTIWKHRFRSGSFYIDSQGEI